MQINSEMEIGNREINSIDFMRAIAIILVIIIHTTTYYTMIHENNNLLRVNLTLNTIAQIAVPIFVFISGYVLTIGYDKTNKLFFYKKRMIKVIIPYIVGTLIYSIYFFCLDQITLKNISHYLLHSSASYHFWYFKLIFQLYLIYPIIYWLYEKIKNTEALTITILMVQIIFNIIFISSSYLFINLNSIMNIFIMFNYIFYFSFGIYCKKKNQCTTSKEYTEGQTGIVLVYFLILILSVLIRYYGLSKNPYFESIENKYYIFIRIIEILQMIMSVYIINIFSIRCKYINSKIKNLFTKFIFIFSKQSFYIYIYHALFIDIIVRLLSRVNVYANQAKFYIILFIGTIISCYISACIVGKIPIISYVLGSKRIKNNSLSKEK